jgi:hypothetical protein
MNKTSSVLSVFLLAISAFGVYNFISSADRTVFDRALLTISSISISTLIWLVVELSIAATKKGR